MVVGEVVVEEVVGEEVVEPQVEVEVQVGALLVGSRSSNSPR